MSKEPLTRTRNLKNKKMPKHYYAGRPQASVADRLPIFPPFIRDRNVKYMIYSGEI